MGEKDMGEVEDLLADLIAIPSTSGEEREIAQFVTEYLGERVGLQPSTDEMHNVVMEFESGREGLTLLLTAHLDTVQPAPGWTYEPHEPTIVDDRIYGLGASDSKGTIAPMITAIRRCLEEHTSSMRGKLILALTSQEENPVGELDGLRYLLKRGLKADLALFGNGFCQNGVPFLTIGHNGYVRYEISVRGRGSHSSTPHLGINAIEKAADLIRILKEVRMPSQEILGETIPATMNVGVIRGGTQPNVVPSECTVIGDRRTLPMERSEKVIDGLQAVLKRRAEQDSELKYEAAFEKLHDAYLLPEDGKIVGLLGRIMEQTYGFKPKLRYDRPYYDADYLGGARIATVMVGSAVPGTPHQPDEYNLLENVRSLERIYTAFIRELLSREQL
ncbi:MAG: M20 family metallopeptidase [Candidatus Geothermarchaeales archaeon]